MNIQSINTSALINPATQRPVAPAADNAGVGIQQPGATTHETPDVSTGPVSNDQLKAAVKATNDFVSMVNDSIQFSVDSDTGKTIVKVVDKSTKEVIRQIPSEEMLAIAKALDNIKGLLVRQKA